MRRHVLMRAFLPGCSGKVDGVGSADALDDSRSDDSTTSVADADSSDAVADVVADSTTTDDTAAVDSVIADQERRDVRQFDQTGSRFAEERVRLPDLAWVSYHPTQRRREMRAVDFDAVRELCLRRDVDLVLASPPAHYVVRLQGQYDCYGDYFSFLMADVEYLDLAGGVTPVGDLRLVSDFNSLPDLVPAWAALRGLYSGPALVIRDAASADWSDISPESLFLAIANRIDCVAGADWDKIARR